MSTVKQVNDKCTWASVGVSPHHILGGGHPGSGRAPSPGFVTALAS